MMETFLSLPQERRAPVAELNQWLGTQKLSGVDRSAQTPRVHIRSPRLHLHTPPNPTCSWWYDHEWLKADNKRDRPPPPPQEQLHDGICCHCFEADCLLPQHQLELCYFLLCSAPLSLIHIFTVISETTQWSIPELLELRGPFNQERGKVWIQGKDIKQVLPSAFKGTDCLTLW